VKLTYKQIEPFINKPDQAARVILIYGPDPGLVRERARLIGKTVVEDVNDAFNAITLDGKSLTEDPAKLNDEAMALSFFGGARLIRIENPTETIEPIVKQYLTNASQQNLVIIEAGELGTQSKLRKLAETAKNAVALPCYIDEEKDLSKIISKMIDDAGYKISHDAISWLASAVYGNRARARTETEKLITYMGDIKTITIEDAQASTGDAGLKTYDDLCYATAGADTEKALKTLDTLFNEGDEVIMALRILQGHFRRLHYVRARVDNGDPLDIVLKELKPPLFYKNEPAFRAQIFRWTLPLLNTALTRLAQLEADSKKTGTPSTILCRQAILSLSKMGPQRKRA
jgi:DNA polymerase-3 subunit delta